jgi:cytochrome P450
MVVRTRGGENQRLTTGFPGSLMTSSREPNRDGWVFDPEAHRDDPYVHYAEFRSLDPVHPHPRIDGVVLTRHADCLDVIRDPRFTSDNRSLRAFEWLKARLERDGGDTRSFDNPGMMGLDGPAHTRLRALVSRGFTPRAVSALVPRIQKVIDGLLDGVRPGTPFDWMQTIAHPMPAIVIAEMLGVPTEDRARFLAWSKDMLAGGPLENRARRRRAVVAGKALTTYFIQIIEQRRADLGSDILSELMAAEQEDGDRLNRDELIATCSLLLLAGHAGTSAMIGNGLLLLLRNPEPLARLRHTPDLWPSAVEEMLRFEGAVPSIVRIATEDVRIRDRTLSKGQTAQLVLAAANRDPDVFEQPDHFDITRHPNHHLAMGRGQHFCLGASLARLEIQIALRTLLERFGDLELATPAPSWSPSGLRSLSSLPVRGRP